MEYNIYRTGGIVMDLKMIPVNEIERYIGIKGIIIIDLRNPIEYREGHIPTAVNIPFEEIEGKKHLLNRYNQIILYCQRGGISLLVSRQLTKLGYNIINVCGGIHEYKGKLSIDVQEKLPHNSRGT
jgi:rhodanese-related sulfurtransferase